MFVRLIRATNVWHIWKWSHVHERQRCVPCFAIANANTNSDQWIFERRYNYTIKPRFWANTTNQTNCKSTNRIRRKKKIMHTQKRTFNWTSIFVFCPDHDWQNLSKKKNQNPIWKLFVFDTLSYDYPCNAFHIYIILTRLTDINVFEVSAVRFEYICIGICDSYHTGFPLDWRI